MEGGFWTAITQAVLAVFAWLAGETGRIAIAGAAGGLVRWFGQEQRHLRDGVIAVAAGILAALYLPPLLVAFLAFWGPQVSLEGQGAQSMGFLAGVIGMSFAKWVTAFFEFRMRREIQPELESDDDQS